VHGATVEEVFWDGDEERAFMAICLETGRECDAYGFVEAERSLLEPGEGAAIARALEYMGDASLVDGGDEEFFCNADHVMEHDRSPRTRRGRGR
jgi:hypothetical protein